MRAAFTDKQMENTLNRDGYVIVNFIEPDELEEIKNTISELGYGKDNEEKFRRSVNHESVARKNEIYEKFNPVFQRAADRFLQDYKLLRVVIFDKLSGGGTTNVHQHPNLVDESKHIPLGAWMPIIATTVKMGTLHVVKGSHSVFNNYIRPYNDYSFFQSKLSYRVLRKYSTPLLLNAGQAVIFHERLIHWSPPNKSSINRTVIQLLLLPRETATDLTFHYRVNNEELLKYQVNPKTYRETDLAHNIPDDLILLGRIKQPRFSYDNRQFIAMMQGANPDCTKQKRNFFHRLFNL